MFNACVEILLPNYNNRTTAEQLLLLQEALFITFIQSHLALMICHSDYGPNSKVFGIFYQLKREVRLTISETKKVCLFSGEELNIPRHG